jgi:phosphoglycolate phosphatase-like HAD superfamily hydrolase
MTTLREAAQQALEAMEQRDNATLWHQAIHALRDALAQQEQQEQQEQEPVDAEAALRCALAQRDWAFKQLQAQPNRREWQSLTDTDIARVFRVLYGGGRFGVSEKEFAIAIEAALKEKNNG